VIALEVFEPSGEESPDTEEHGDGERPSIKLMIRDSATEKKPPNGSFGSAWQG